MYSSMAVSLPLPLLEFQASHLALPFMSSIPGRDVLQSPTLACLKSPYKTSWSAWEGAAGSLVAASAAALKSSYDRRAQGDGASVCESGIAPWGRKPPTEGAPPPNPSLLAARRGLEGSNYSSRT